VGERERGAIWEKGTEISGWQSAHPSTGKPLPQKKNNQRGSGDIRKSLKLLKEERRPSPHSKSHGDVRRVRRGKKAARGRENKECGKEDSGIFCKRSLLILTFGSHPLSSLEGKEATNNSRKRGWGVSQGRKNYSPSGVRGTCRPWADRPGILTRVTEGEKNLTG